MTDLIGWLLGPLTAIECRMALARGSLVIVRTLAAAVVLGVALIVIWWWWLNQLGDSLHSPGEELRVGLFLVDGLLVALALILGPAVLAGSLAGDKERGALALLLTTRVNSREIVTSRLIGKLSQVGMILLACLPALVLIGSFGGISLKLFLISTILPIAVGFGGGGLAVLSSTISRRARDSLLAVYLLDLLLLLTPLSRVFGLSATQLGWFSAFNPFTGLEELINKEDVGHAVQSISIWSVMGLIGMITATWRLRPAALAPIGGDHRGRKGYRQLWVPPIHENRPMIWKELFIERVGSLGLFGRWVGLFLILSLFGGSLILGGINLWAVSKGDPNGWGLWAKDILDDTIVRSAFLVCCLIEWGIGLRAGVTISSERERGTWDSILTCPLDGAEIVIGKVWGSLFALRWLIVSAWFAWLVCVALDVMPWWEGVNLFSRTLVEGAFMAAVGVRTSLQSNTATRAMSVSIGIWIAAYIVVRMAAGILILMVLLLCNTALVFAAQIGVATPPTAFWAPLSDTIAWPLATHSLYLGLTLGIVADTRLRFDRLAGRMTEGSFAIAVDKFFHGQPKSLEAAEAELALIHGERPDGILEDGRESVVEPVER